MPPLPSHLFPRLSPSTPSFHPPSSTHLLPPTSFYPPPSTHLLPPTSFYPPPSTHLLLPTSFHPSSPYTSSHPSPLPSLLPILLTPLLSSSSYLPHLLPFFPLYIFSTTLPFLSILLKQRIQHENVKTRVKLLVLFCIIQYI